MQNTGRSVHLNQILYVLLFAKPFNSFVYFSLFHVSPLETSAPTQASLQAAAKGVCDPKEVVREVMTVQLSPLANLSSEHLLSKLLRKESNIVTSYAPCSAQLSVQIIKHLISLCMAVKSKDDKCSCAIQ